MNKCILVLAVVLFNVVAFAQNNHNNVSDKVAVKGYDPVAYFKQHKAVKGKKEFSLSHDGAVYYFANAADKEAFAKNPTQYAPQYGGWCAYAMGSYGDKVDINPETFKITDGKLYLFYNAFFNNTLNDWNKDEANLKRKADANWKKTIQ